MRSISRLTRSPTLAAPKVVSRRVCGMMLTPKRLPCDLVHRERTPSSATEPLVATAASKSPARRTRSARNRPPAAARRSSATASTWPETICPPSSSPALSARSRLMRRADAPIAEGGARQRLGRGLHREPVGALLDDGEADAGAGDRRAEREIAEIEMRSRCESRCRRRDDRAHGADIGDDSREHGCNTRPTA